jgi:hypothetical protein
MNWLRRMMSGRDSPRQPSAAGGTIESDADKVFLDESLQTQDVTLIGPKRSVRMGAVVFATILLSGRSAGWRGGTHLFQRVPGGSVLLPLRTGTQISAADAHDLGHKLRLSLVAIEGEGFDTTLESAEFFSEGGFSIRVHKRGA